MTSRPATSTRQSRASRRAGVIVGIAIVVAFIAALLVADAFWAVPDWVALLYLGMSTLCFIVYAVDKSAAVAGRRRISENTLLGLGLVGGWPGAILAQQFLRHKLRKRPFMVPFVATVGANVGVLVLLLTPLGSRILDALL